MESINGHYVQKTFAQNADISTARDITVAPPAGLKVVLTEFIISVETAAYVTIQMETSGNVLFGAYMAANSTLHIKPGSFLKADTAAKKLQMKSSVASKGACTAIYFMEA